MARTRRHGNSKIMQEAPLRCPRCLHYGPFPASSARNWAASELAASNEPNWLQDSGGSTEVRNALTCLLWRPMVKFSLAMKIPLRPSQTTGMQQDTEHNSHCLNNSPWWPWCRISFSHFTVTMQASAQLWLIWRRLSNTFMALLDQLRTSSFTPVITERWETYGQTPEGIQDSKQINLRKANNVSEDNLLDPRNTRPINS